MSDLFWLSDAQMARLEPYFPKSHGKPRVDDRRVLIGIIFINRNGLRWRDAPAEYGPHKTLYNRWKRWSDKGVFARIMVGLAAEHGEKKTAMIDATYLKAGCMPSATARDVRLTSSSPPDRSATTLAHGHCWAACQRSIGCWATVAMMRTGSGKR